MSTGFLIFAYIILAPFVLMVVGEMIEICYEFYKKKTTHGDQRSR